MLDQINLLKDTTNKYVDQIGEKLSQCLEIFTQDQSLEDISSKIELFKREVLQDGARR